MERHVFIQMSKLHNVKGRISYITSTAKQENLYATYRTCNNEFWSGLAKENRADFERSGTAGECIEARELIIALPECYTAYQPQDKKPQIQSEGFYRLLDMCRAKVRKNRDRGWER